MSELRRTYSRAEIEDTARAFMLEQFGKPAESTDRDVWYERYGLLVLFIGQLWDKDEPTTRLAPPLEVTP